MDRINALCRKYFRLQFRIDHVKIQTLSKPSGNLQNILILYQCSKKLNAKAAMKQEVVESVIITAEFTLTLKAEDEGETTKNVTEEAEDETDGRIDWN